MKLRQADRSLRLGALKEIERSLRSRLRAYDLSTAFIERSLEDALQKGLVEYLRAIDRGEVIDNPAGFIVQAGFCRAIDELRREARQADGTLIDALIESGGVAEPSTDEVAMDHLEAEELREAVGRLSPEEQQVLSLRYFDGLTNEASAKVLFCSKRTYRRRLSAALKKLEQHLGAPVPEPGSQLAIELGVVLWVALRGAKVALAQGPLEQLVRLMEWVTGRTGGSENAERALTLAGSGPAKVVGGCTAAAAACLLAVGGTELAGIGAGGRDRPDRAPVERAESRPAPRIVDAPAVPSPAPSGSSSQRTATDSSSSASGTAKQREREANREVESQGTGALFKEESSPAPAPHSGPVESSTPSPEESPNSAAESQGTAGLLP